MTYPPIRSFGQLVSAKTIYDRSEQTMDHAKLRLAYFQEQLASATDDKSRTLYEEGIKTNIYTIKQTEYVSNHFDEMIASFEKLTRFMYKYDGNFLNKSEDGTYSWGKFTVSNQYTGEIAFSHNGDGLAKQLDGIGGQPYFYTPLH